MTGGMETVLVTLSGQVESGDAKKVTHHTPPVWHTWAGAGDIAHAATTGQPDPSTSRCGCPCADVDAAQPDLGDDDDEVDYSDPGEPESYTQEPCPVCDAEGACGWDADGRPLIHAVPVGEVSIASSTQTL